MAIKKQKMKVSRSRSTSRSRSSSRRKPNLRNSSRSQSLSRKSPANSSRQQSPAVESRSHSRSSSATKQLSETKRVPRVSAKIVGTRSSVRVAERLEVVAFPNNVESSSTQIENKIDPEKKCFVNRKMLPNLLQVLECLFTAILFPFVIYYCMFLVVSPTLERTFSIVSSNYGTALAFCGASIPFKWKMSDLSLICCVTLFPKFLMVINKLIPFGPKYINCLSENRMNGLVVVVLSATAIAFYELMGADLVGGCSIAILCDYFPSVFIGLWIETFCLAVHVLWNSHRSRNMCGIPSKTPGHCFISLFNGCAIRPNVCGLDIKMTLYYPAFVGAIVLQSAVVARYYHNHGTISPGLLVSLILYAIVVLDHFAFERTALYSYDTLYSGCGLKWIQRVLIIWPFVHSLSVIHFGYNIHAGYINIAQLAFGVVVFLSGVYIRRRSINQKFLFCVDFQDQMIECPNSLTMDKRLLSGGWWGVVRHPDYLGIIIMLVGAVIPLGFNFIVTWILILFGGIDVLLRISSEERTYENNFASNWDKYTKTVRYRLVPRLY